MGCSDFKATPSYFHFSKYETGIANHDSYPELTGNNQKSRFSACFSLFLILLKH